VRDVTIRNEETTFNALFKWAGRQGLTHFDRVDFEEIKIRDIDRRPTFTWGDFNELHLALKDYVWPTSLTAKELEHRRFIRDFIYINAHTFLRFGELRNLKWGDVRLFEKAKTLLVDVHERK
jgi:integrase